MDRISYDDYFMLQAKLISSRSTCDRAYVGCVLTKDNEVIATGYNGSVSGTEHCNDEGHYMVEGHCIRTIHAEQNALIQCAKKGVSTVGATAYVTHFPCQICTKLLIQSGITKIIYENAYRIDPFAKELLDSKGIELVEKKVDKSKLKEIF